MKTSERFTFRVPRRLAKILHNTAKAFRDYDVDDPYRGSLTRAFEHILQYYSESEDYRRKAGIDKKTAKYILEKERELIESFVNA